MLSMAARGAVPLVGAPVPGAVRFLFLVGPLASSPTGPLLLLLPVSGLRPLVLLLVPMFLFLLVLMMVLVLGIGLLLLAVFLLVVVHLVASGALLSSGGALLVPLAGS